MNYTTDQYLAALLSQGLVQTFTSPAYTMDQVHQIYNANKLLIDPIMNDQLLLQQITSQFAVNVPNIIIVDKSEVW